MRYGLRAQSAPLVRASSRRIMSMRFRPAYISLINRRARSSAVTGAAVGNLKAHQREGVPDQAAHQIPECQDGARAQGVASLRQTTARPCPLRAVPAKPLCDGRLRREHLEAFYDQIEKEGLTGRSISEIPHSTDHSLSRRPAPERRRTSGGRVPRSTAGAHRPEIARQRVQDDRRYQNST